MFTTLFLPAPLPIIMVHAGIGFNTTRVDRGSGINVVIGTMGEMAKIDDKGGLVEDPAKPFPASVFDGVLIHDRWVGIWIDRELRDARMAALPLEQEWSDGPDREELRMAISSQRSLYPAGAIWHKRLDAEPIKMGAFEDKIVFATIDGLYMIDSDSNEVWRGVLPFWKGITEIGVEDRIVAICEFPGGVSLWSRAGGVAVLDPVQGGILYSRELVTSDSIEGVFYAENGGWVVCLHGGNVLLMDKIEGDTTLVRTKGPILDSEYSNIGWRLTGWRNDVLIREGENEATVSPRESIGIGIVGDMVITNDGEWSRFSA